MLESKASLCTALQPQPKKIDERPRAAPLPSHNGVRQQGYSKWRSR